jgi:hypothetical protein
MKTREKPGAGLDGDYREVSPELQRIRGPYPIASGMEAYVKHANWHPS